MSDSLNRRVVSYPHPKVYNQTKALAEKQGTTVSKIVEKALKEYLEKPIIKK